VREINLDLEIITPLVLHGADGSTPEIRPPSLKGMMRYWWRAVRAEKTSQLLKEEARLFGSSNSKTGGKSKFGLRFVNSQLNIDRVSLLPHQKDKKAQAQAFKPGQKFTAILFSVREVELYQDILEISLLLGGLGKRSRRGFGSLHYSKWNFKNKSELQNYLLQKLNRLADDSFEAAGSLIKRKSLPDADYPFIKEVSFGHPATTVENLLVNIGNASHIHRDNALGCFKPRMASPVYVSVVKLEGEFIPVITMLNSKFPRDFKNYNLTKQDEFKKSLYG